MLCPGSPTVRRWIDYLSPVRTDGASLGFGALASAFTLQRGALSPPPGLDFLSVLVISGAELCRTLCELGTGEGLSVDHRANEPPEDEPAVVRVAAVETEDELVDSFELVTRSPAEHTCSVCRT